MSDTQPVKLLLPGLSFIRCFSCPLGTPSLDLLPLLFTYALMQLCHRGVDFRFESHFLATNVSTASTDGTTMGDRTDNLTASGDVVTMIK